MTVSTRTSAAVAIACFLVVLGALLALHLLRPEFDPLTHRLSEYAIGPYGFLMTVAFAVAGLGLLALGHTVWHGVRHSFWIGLACAAMVAAAAADGLMAWFVADPYGPHAVVTFSGRVHDVLALSHAFCWSVAIGATPLGLFADPRRRRFALASLGLSGLVVLAMAVRTFSGLTLLGLTQRLWIGGVLVWSVAHAIALRETA